MKDSLPIQPTRGERLRWKLPVLAAIIVVLFLLLLPSVGPGREGARCEQCKRNLRAIGLALQSYHAKHGSFPPAYLADESGRPIHSWRVLILPFMDQQEIYDEYRFDEPWDGPHNSALHDRLKKNPYFCNSARQPNQANYVAVVGPGTAMPGMQSRKLNELRTGASGTILVVEALNCGTHWMEPKDLHFDEMCFGINDPSGRGVASNHSGIKLSEWRWTKHVPLAHVLLADGTVREMPETTPPRTIHKLLMIDTEETSPKP